MPWLFRVAHGSEGFVALKQIQTLSLFVVFLREHLWRMNQWEYLILLLMLIFGHEFYFLVIICQLYIPVLLFLHKVKASAFQADSF
jgi:hypothetical protein